MSDAKPPIRWDWVEEQWQLGRLSNHEISREHERQFGRSLAESAIRKRVSQHGWQRDLSEAVKHETRRKLALGSTPTEVRESAQESAQESVAHHQADLVETAADENVRVILVHRKDAEKIRATADLLNEHLLKQLLPDPQGRVNEFEPGELKDIGSVAKQCADLRKTAVEIERKAYNLESDEPAAVKIEFCDDDSLADASRGAEEAPTGSEAV